MGAHGSEIVVVGAGIIGASIAWRLAQAGLEVTLADAGLMGGEASWAGAGMLAPGGEIDRATAWAAMALESLAMYPVFVQELREESGAAIDYRAPGGLDIVCSEREWEQLRARATAQSGVGIVAEALDSDRLRELVPGVRQDATGALYFPRDALVDPREVMQTLRICCIGRGVTIHEHRPVTAIRVRDGGVEIDTPQGALAAEAAVIAAGAWSGAIPLLQAGPGVRLPSSFPVKGHLVGYRLAPGTLGPIVRHAGTYVLQRSSGFTVAGSSEERIGFDRGVDQAIAAGIEQRASSILPGLLGGSSDERWVGFRPAVASLEPEIRRLPGTTVWLSYGHYRNGILLAPSTAARVSREIIASSGKDSISTAEPG